MKKTIIISILLTLCIGIFALQSFAKNDESGTIPGLPKNVLANKTIKQVGVAHAAKKAASNTDSVRWVNVFTEVTFGQETEDLFVEFVNTECVIWAEQDVNGGLVYFVPTNLDLQKGEVCIAFDIVNASASRDVTIQIQGVMWSKNGGGLYSTDSLSYDLSSSAEEQHVELGLEYNPDYPASDFYHGFILVINAPAETELYMYNISMLQRRVVDTNISKLITFGNEVNAVIQNEGEYPWVVVGGELQPGNVGVQSSTSEFVINLDNQVESVLSFDWWVDSEGGCDVLYYSVDGNRREISGQNGTDSTVVDLSTGRHSLVFGYRKDGSVNYGKDYGTFENLTITLMTEKLIIQSRANLLSAINEAYSMGFSVASAYATYCKEDATYEELVAARDSLIATIAANEMTEQRELNLNYATLIRNCESLIGFAVGTGEIDYSAPLLNSVSQLGTNIDTYFDSYNNLDSLLDNDRDTGVQGYYNGSDYSYIEASLEKFVTKLYITYNYLSNSSYSPNEVEIQVNDGINGWKAVKRHYDGNRSGSVTIPAFEVGATDRIRFVPKTNYYGYTNDYGYPYFSLGDLQVYGAINGIFADGNENVDAFATVISEANAKRDIYTEATSEDVDSLTNVYTQIEQYMYSECAPVICNSRSLPYEYVTINFTLPKTQLYYSINGGEAVAYEGQFRIEESCEIEAWSVHNGIRSKSDSLHIDLDPMVVIVQKPGEFAQTYLDMNENDWSRGDLVKVVGDLNQIDLNNIKNLTSLVKLDLSEAVFSSTPSSWLSGKQYLLKVILPESLTVLGENSFYNCPRLESVTVAGENNIATISSQTFYNCSKLTSLDAPKARTIGNYAFYGCTSFDCKSASSVTSLGTYAFYNTGITKVDADFFSPQIKTIPSYLFYGCTKLTEVALPNTITSISDRAFYNCTALDSIVLSPYLASIGSYAFYNCKFKEIALPDRLTSIGSYAFNNCNNLQTIKCKAVTPPVASGSFVNANMTNLELFVPPFAVDAYRNTAYWENFYKIRSLLEPIDYIYVERPVTINISEEDSELLTNNPRIVMTNYNNNTFGQLTINGEGTLSASVIDLYPTLYYRDYGRSTSCGMPTLINNADKMRTDSLSVHMTLNYSDRWYFITLPYDVQVKDIVPSANTYWVIRKYDSEARATGTGTTWVDLTADDVMEAGKGYIVRAYKYNASPQLTFPSRNTVSKNNIFRSTDVIVPLEEHIAEFAHNRSWNLIGNPYPAYFSSNMILDNTGETTTAPITIWRGSSYQAYSPVDDDLIIRPYESFFIQRPLDLEELTFPTEGRMHFDEAYNASSSSGHGAFAPRRNSTEASNGREVFNFNITMGDLDNRARIVLNEDAKMEYEVGRDAAKFFDVENNSPLLYVTADQSYEICERPMADGKATLGLHIAAEGLYTISLSGRHNSGWNVWLTDNEAGRTVNLAAEDYTFNAKKSADAKRFSVRFDNETTDIKSIESLDQNAQVTITTVGGVEVFKGRLADFNHKAAGIYIISTNGEAVKIAIK